MQTFLPYPDFAASAAALDRARLGKQRVETLQILRALVIPDYGWQNHPAVRMWMGHIPALAAYGAAMADEWLQRGGADTTRPQIMEFAPELWAEQPQKAEMPPWLGDEDLHRSHRSNLIRKDPEFYRSAFASIPDDLPYVWPEPEHPMLPAEPEDDRLWILRTSTAVDPEDLHVLSLPRERVPGRKSRKWQRQFDAFVSALSEGDDVAVPVDGGSRFLTATVTGGVREAEDGGMERPVSVRDIVDRAAFAYPALLQDPRTLFAVPRP